MSNCILLQRFQYPVLQYYLLIDTYGHSLVCEINLSPLCQCPVLQFFRIPPGEKSNRYSLVGKSHCLLILREYFCQAQLQLRLQLQLQLKLSLLYFHFLQPPTHPPTRRTTRFWPVLSIVGSQILVQS